MHPPIVEIKNIGKKYNITHQRGGYIALRDVLMNILRSPFAFLKLKGRQVAGFEAKEDFWALRGINLTVKKGEVVGIIGPNGAGKSTLLKILSQITPPTEGEITIRGKVGSLLEVGTGFHPELSGRENIFLNGAILGMTRKEIAKKFDQIVEFAGIEKFLDTPVKYYSSGMYVRLAFSVAAHMEPDILIVDEVLAVGDAEFQKKCLGKMDEITKNEGRTILFVSHNMGAISSLCQRAILIERGSIVKSGPVQEVISTYMNRMSHQSEIHIQPENGRAANITSIRVQDKNKTTKKVFDISENITIVVEYTVFQALSGLQLSLLLSKNMVEILNMFDTDQSEMLPMTEPGSYTATCKIPAMFLKSGNYQITAGLGIPTKLIQNVGTVVSFEIEDTSTNTQHKSYRKDRAGVVISPATWSIKKQ